MTELIVLAIALSVRLAIETVFLFAALWIMIKLQKLDYFFWGLLGSAVLASALDIIPFVGHYCAFGILLFCVKKATQSDYTDALFTVGIGYALTFCMNLWLIGALMGDLRLPTSAAASDEEAPVAVTDAPPTNAPVTLAKAPAKVDATKSSAPDSKDLAVKLVTRIPGQTSVTIRTKAKSYTVFLGESAMVQTGQSSVSIRFKELGKDWVVLAINGQDEKFSLQ